MSVATASEKWIETPKPCTPGQIKSFVNDGYLILPNLVSPAEVEELRQDAVKVARGEYPCDNLKPLPTEMSDEETLRNILCIHNPHHVSPVMLRYIKHPKVCGALSQITAAHLPFWDGSVKAMQSMLFVKPPGFQGQAWHQDEIFIPTRDRSLIGAWIALDDATVENGCLFVVPGSHRSGYLYPSRPHDNPDEFDVSAESYGFDDSKEVAVEVKAGSVVFFNGHLLHRSRKNRSDIYRRVLVSHYMNAWSLLPWEHQEGVKAGLQDMRAVIPVAGVDPYAWKGIDPAPNSVYLRQCKANAGKG